MTEEKSTALAEIMPEAEQAQIAEPQESEAAISGETADSSEKPGKSEASCNLITEDTAQIESGEPGLFKYAAKTGVFLIGLFAAIIYAICVIDGFGSFLESGFERLALGEIYGGADNISVITGVKSSPSDTAMIPDAPLDLSSIPANEHETEQVRDDASAGISEGDSEKIKIITADISADAENGLEIINETPYSPALTADTERSIPTLSELYSQYGSDAPVVLILHTHTTESYAENGAEYTSQEHYRSTDPQNNVTEVGKALADMLSSRGINTIHCTDMMDAEDFNLSYYKAALKIRKYLEDYPSISYIFDIHRDSIPYSDGEKTIRPAVEIDGKQYAQAMIVVGTDYGGSGHTGWKENFSLACRIQSSIFAERQNIMRPINLRSASFNEQYTKGSLLLEMGAVGSSLEEACSTAKLIGSYIADEIIG